MPLTRNIDISIKCFSSCFVRTRRSSISGENIQSIRSTQPIDRIKVVAIRSNEAENITGVLPLQFTDNINRKNLNLKGSELISINEIEKAMERDRFFDPEEALKFGLIDKVITNREDK